MSQVSDSLHIYMHTSDTLGSLHVYMHLVCACKRAVIRLSDVFNTWTVSPMTDVCMKMWSEPIV